MSNIYRVLLRSFGQKALRFFSNINFLPYYAHTQYYGRHAVQLEKLQRRFAYPKP